MRPQYDIVVLGDYFFDLIYCGLSEFPELGREVVSSNVVTTGGAMYITAVSLHRLGVKVGWPAYFGNDYYSEAIHGFASDEGLDLSLSKHVDAPYRRVTTALPLHGERAFVRFADPEADDLYAHWLAAMQSCDFKHLHLGGLDCIERLTPILDHARAVGATISSDCQDGSHLHAPYQCRQNLAKLDIFMPNVREALIVAECDQLADALVRLAEIVPLVVIKDGANGAWVATGRQIIHIHSVSAGPVIDTTGAGDCFNAGFLYGHVVEGASVDRCALYGNICGGFSVTASGGATAAPSLETLGIWAAKAATTEQSV